MRRLAIPVLLAGCNAAFDLDRTVGTHAYFDAPPDAPFSCPGLGDTPRFKRTLVQVLTQDCDSYTVSQRTGRALARCDEPARGVYEGPIDGALTPTSIVPAADRYFGDVRLAADGELAVASDCPTGLATCALVAYRRNVDGTWGAAAPTGVTLGPNDELSAPSLPPRRLLVVVRSLRVVDEYAERGDGAWALATRHPFPADDLLTAHLAPDGLRLTGFGRAGGSTTYEALYLDRAAVTDAFTQPRVLTAPPERELALTEDCGRAYFTALRSVFFVERE